MSDSRGPRRERDWQVIIGVGILLIGMWLLFRELVLPFIPGLDRVLDQARDLGWPLVLVVLGIAFIVYSQRPGVSLPERGARLYRSRRKRVVSGVFGGLSDYFGVDATVLRLVFVALALFLNAGPAIFAYIVASIVIPEEPKEMPAQHYAPPPPPPPPGGYAPPPQG